MKETQFRIAFFLLLVTAGMLLFVSCGKGSRSATSGGVAKLPGGRLSPAASADIAGDLAALEKPADVPDDVWTLLTEELKRQLESGSVRGVAGAPTGDANKPVVTLTDPGDGSVTIEWDYANVGDYDRTGEVGVPDITPIAQNYLRRSDDGLDDDALEAWIDGDGNNEVGVSDITPIANNYLATLTEYEIHRSDSATVLGPEVGFVDFVPPTGNEIPHFTWTDTAPPTGASYYVVMAHNTDMEEGAMSDPIEFTAGIPITTDTTYPSLNIAVSERYNVLNDARLHVTGDANIDGELRGVNGNLYLEVDGNLTVSGGITLDSDPDLQPPGDPFDSIYLVVHGNTTFADTATVETDGSVFIVKNEAEIPTPDQVDVDTDTDDGVSPVIAPFAQGGLSPSSLSQPFRFNEAPRGASQAGNTVTLAGTFVVRKPPRGVKSIVFAVWPSGSDVVVQNFVISGPDGHDGLDDFSGASTAAGTDGERALNMNFNAPDGEINFDGNVTFNLGSGGRGGGAVAIGDNDADATGGSGGQPSKLKIRADFGINVTGTFTINPGHGGDGGFAEAYGATGMDGCPAENGGNAAAYGGHGASVDRVLTYRGVGGIANVEFGTQSGGIGGYATASAGNGGNDTCVPGGFGGYGGNALADAGDGGNSYMDVTGAAGGGAFGGDGGDAFVDSGWGGNGNSFADKTPGGDGGDGGAMSCYAGAGGLATTTDGLDGATNIDPDAGHGGDGGDGCPPGVGGLGGGWDWGVGGVQMGTGKGLDGVDGESTCFIWYFMWAWITANGTIDPGVYTHDIFDDDTGSNSVGTMSVELLDIPDAVYYTQDFPFRHIGYCAPAMMRLQVDSILLNQGVLGDVTGIMFQTAQPMDGIDEFNPLVIEAFDSDGNSLGSVDITDPLLELVNADFGFVDTPISYFDLFVPSTGFVTFGSIIIIDP